MDGKRLGGDKKTSRELLGRLCERRPGQVWQPWREKLDRVQGAWGRVARGRKWEQPVLEGFSYCWVVGLSLRRKLEGGQAGGMGLALQSSVWGSQASFMLFSSQDCNVICWHVWFPH